MKNLYGIIIELYRATEKLRKLKPYQFRKRRSITAYIDTLKSRLLELDVFSLGDITYSLFWHQESNPLNYIKIAGYGLYFKINNVKIDYNITKHTYTIIDDNITTTYSINIEMTVIPNCIKKLWDPLTSEIKSFYIKSIVQLIDILIDNAMVNYNGN